MTLLGMALALGVLAVAPAAAGAEQARPLRVVTFNILHGGPGSGLRGDGDRLEERLQLAGEQLRGLAPDVVALQEASVGWGRGNVAARLAAVLGLPHHVHAPATERVFPLRVFGWLLVRLMNFNEGPALLSRFPIVASEVYDLPRCVRKVDPRVLLRAELDTPAGRWSVFSTHLSRDDCQARRVSDLVRAHPAELPAVVMGDFNASETSAAITTLTREGGFVDVFRAANPDAPGATVWQRIESPTPTVFRRVDYVFMVPGGRLTGEVLDSRVVLDTPARRPDGGTLWPSDHYGVLADLRLVPRRTGAR